MLWVRNLRRFIGSGAGLGSEALMGIYFHFPKNFFNSLLIIKCFILAILVYVWWLLWLGLERCWASCREENLYIESTQKYAIPVIPSHLFSVHYLISMVFLVCSLCCRAFIYFSYPAPKDLVSRLKSDMSVLPRIGALREVRSSYYFLILIHIFFSEIWSKRWFHCRWIWNTFL